MRVRVLYLRTSQNFFLLQSDMSCKAATAQYGKRHAMFLAAFREESTCEFRPFTAVQFLEVWRHFDIDGVKWKIIVSDEL